MRRLAGILVSISLIFLVLLVLHFPLLRLPYFWDEAGYYIPAALDFYRHWLLIPHDTLPTGHTPLVSVYLAAAWHAFGFSRLVTRSAMILVAAVTVFSTYLLGRRVGGRKTGVWAAVLLALMPLFFAQSSLAFLDLTAALFTTLAIICVLDDRWLLFALTASLAVLSKETAIVVLLPVWAYMAFRRKERQRGAWLTSAVPIAPLIAWALFYHSRTGYWTGNASYLQYNLYAALAPLHILRSLIARLAELLFQGFNWILVLGAIAGIRWAAKRPSQAAGDRLFGDFRFLAVGTVLVYVIMLSVVGGAILPRYMLPAFPLFFVLLLVWIGRLPPRVARTLHVAAAACFIAAWFINPPYPFPYEDNLAYSDFIRLHQRAAKYLESLPGDPAILTAWPGTDELKQPFLGYVTRALNVRSVDDFTAKAFAAPPNFDFLYLYSRKWDPQRNVLSLWPFSALRTRFYGSTPPVPTSAVAARFHLSLVREYSERGQWVRIYESKRWAGSGARNRGMRMARPPIAPPPVQKLVRRSRRTLAGSG